MGPFSCVSLAKNTSIHPTYNNWECPLDIDKHLPWQKNHPNLDHWLAVTF